MAPLLIRAGRLIDGTGAGPLPDRAIVIDDGRIRAVEPWADRAGGPFVDLGDHTVLPGFVDTHLHLMLDPGHPTTYFDPDEPLAEVMLRAVANAQAALSAGLTTVGDCGAIDEIIFPLREAVNRGELRGPRILASGRPIVPAGGHAAQMGRLASGIDEVRAAVRAQAKAGADFIKVMATGGGGEDPGHSHFSLDELVALRREADAYGLPVAAHAHGSEGIDRCVRAGIQRIEHCTFYDGQRGFSFRPSVAAAIAAAGIIVSPTNAIDYRRMERGGTGAPREELNAVWRGLLRSGVRLAASSDAGVTDMMVEDFALIPQLMVAELGMAPMDAIVACTRTGAAALRLQDEVGTLEPGKQADLVAVAGNPLDDITAMRAVEIVVHGGEIVHRTPEWGAIHP